MFNFRNFPHFSMCNCLAVLLAMVCAGQASAQTAPAPETPASQPAPKATTQLKAVEIVGKVSDTEQRRASTASKIVISKEEIERFGDSSVAEVLKRLPGVTDGGRPGRGGADLRMRGMGGGYTQLLVNGERMGPGYTLADIPPDQVERIEIMRAPTAEFGARAVAGTINVVLKEALKRELNEFRAGVGLEGGRASQLLSWTRNDKLGQAVDYTFTVSAMHTNRQDDVDNRTFWVNQPGDVTVLDQHETGASVSQRDGLHLNGRVQMKLGPGETLSVMPFLIVSSGTLASDGQLEQAPGGAIAQPYGSYHTDGSGSFGMLRINTQWQKQLSDATRMETRVGVGVNNASSQSLRQEFSTTGQPSRTTQDQSDTRDNSLTVNAKLWRQLESEHSLVSGLEIDASQRNQTRTTLQDGLPILGEFGDDLTAATLRMAGYVQDEWNLNKQISAYAGLRWEGIRTSSDRDNSSVSNLSSVMTPLFHATWRPTTESRDQVRTSLTRSYKAATLSDLIARPSLSQRFPTGANEIGSPDSAGNPSLRPELASGVELGYEHYLTKGGLLSANVFYRSITDLIRRTLALETVSWSDQQRWVSRPQNVGHALTYGLELEAKFRLDECFDGALPLSLRTNLSLFDSKVDDDPGPNNRLEGQPKGTANLGADYQLRQLPLSLGFSVNYTPAYAVRLSDVQNNTVSSKRVSDAFVLWKVNHSTQLRLSASNLLPRDYITGSSVVNGMQTQNNQSKGVSHANWGLRMEMKM
jgi:iron complex outermembrane receptor protein